MIFFFFGVKFISWTCGLPSSFTLHSTADQRQPKEPKELFFVGQFSLVEERKDSLNIKGLSNSQFAEILLHRNIEELRARRSSFQETSYDNQESISSKISIQFNLSISSPGHYYNSFRFFSYWVI